MRRTPDHQRKKKYIRYYCDQCTVFEIDESECFIYFKDTGKCGKVKKSFRNLGLSYRSREEIHIGIFDIFAYGLLILLPLVIGGIAMRLIGSDLKITVGNMILACLYFVVFIVLHEYAHYISLFVYKCAIRLPSVKLSGGFLKFFTDTTLTYLLPKYKRFVVYAAGEVFGIYFIYATLRFTELPPCIVVFALLNSIINLIPSQSEENDMMIILRMLAEKEAVKN